MVRIEWGFEWVGRIVFTRAFIKRDINSLRASYFPRPAFDTWRMGGRRISRFLRPLPSSISRRHPIIPPTALHPLSLLFPRSDRAGPRKWNFLCDIAQKLIRLTCSLCPSNSRSGAPLGQPCFDLESYVVENRCPPLSFSLSLSIRPRFSGWRRRAELNGATQGHGACSKGSRLQAIVPAPPFVSNPPFLRRPFHHLFPPPPSSFFVFLIRNFVTSPVSLPRAQISDIVLLLSLTSQLSLADPSTVLHILVAFVRCRRRRSRRPSSTIISPRENLTLPRGGKSFCIYSLGGTTLIPEFTLAHRCTDVVLKRSSIERGAGRNFKYCWNNWTNYFFLLNFSPSFFNVETRKEG